jgi:hypothetical protein
LALDLFLGIVTESCISLELHFHGEAVADGLVLVGMQLCC